MDTLKYQDLQILGEIYKQYIISKDRNVLELQGNFDRVNVFHVLHQIGVGYDDYTVDVFPNSEKTIIRFK